MSDTTVLFKTKECWSCEGEGREVRAMYRHNSIARMDSDFVRAGKTATKCGNCNGFGYLTKNHEAYKSKGMAERHQAKNCYMCGAHGEVHECHMWYDCAHCRGQGVELVWDNNGNTIPDNIDLFTGDAKEFFKDYFDNVRIIVVTGRKSQTWGENNIGRGLVSVTDYGSGFDLHSENPEAFIAKVREGLMKGYNQLIKITNSKTDRRVANVIAIDLSENGYSVIPSNDNGSYGSLPSSYEKVIHQPIS